MPDERRKILIQLDTDAHPSVFDRVVAIDAGADEVFSYGEVEPCQVRNLVHGAIFTRGARHLRFTAIFIGGSDVACGTNRASADTAGTSMLPEGALAAGAAGATPFW